MYLRRAVPGDEDTVARVHVISWQAAYRGLLSDEYLDGLDPADRAARYTFGDTGRDRPSTTMAVDEERDEICGFSSSGPCRDRARPDAGELYAIYVHPDWWNRGVGRLLMDETRIHLADQGFAHAVLWVLVGNERAMRFYRTDGWRPDGQRRIEEVHGISVDEICYVRSLP